MTKPLLLTLALGAALASLTASASLATGQWRQYPVFGQTIDKVVDSPQKVYYITGGTLYSYDKGADETRSYVGALSDNAVADIWYNQADKSLLVAYENANIDYLYDDGNVVNVPDIKDASVDFDKAVTAVDFHDGRTYVCTTFGLVILDDARHDVVQSGIYNVTVTGAVALGDQLLITTAQADADGNAPYYAIPLTGRVNALSNFKEVAREKGQVLELRAVDREKGNFVAHTVKGLQLWQHTPAKTQLVKGNQCGDEGKCSDIIEGKDGTLYVTYYTKLKKIIPEWVSDVAAVPATLKDAALGIWEGPESVWAGNNEGLAHYKLAADGDATVLSQPYRPGNVTTARIATIFSQASDGRGFYISNHGQSGFRPGESSDPDGTKSIQGLDYVYAGTITNADLLEGVEYDLGDTKWRINQVRKGDGVLAPRFVLSDPDDPQALWIGSGFEGVYVAKNGKQVAKFFSGGKHYDNAPFNPWWGCHAQAGAFDARGNLWVATWDSQGGTPLMMLPAAKRRNPATVKKTDWLTFDQGGNVDPDRNMMMLACKNSNMVFWTAQRYQAPLVVIDTKGTDKTADDVSRVWTTFVDQDGKSYREIERTALAEDMEGRVWMATNEGIFEFSNPAGATDPDFRVNHLKVPRNDGTNLADYLLPTDVVTAISVDGSNRKWIATANSGIYLVSPRGDEIIEHFTTANSPLSTNAIAGIHADPESNSVFVGTVNGLYEYSSDGAPARDDYDEVYAYPNPVTPDYGGWITIANLMANSLVKICDSSMAVVAQMTSEGGMALWDGCDLSGRRVRSGVYYVVASTGTDGSSTSSNGGVVAKILVVN